MSENEGKKGLNRRTILLGSTSIVAASALASARAQAPTEGRDVLPIPNRKPVGLTTYDAKDPDTKFPPIRQLRPPAGAPNVLVILLDDVGFGASSAFGGPCQTPTAERLAGNGLKYARFHTTALWSPSRAALSLRSQSSRRRHGRDHRDGHLCARLQFASAQHLRAAARNSQA